MTARRAGSPLRIAVVSTVYKPTPPIGYGGIECVVSEFAEALCAAGHEVVLFACEGSRFSGELVTIAAPDRARTGVNKASDRVSEEPLYRAMRERLAARPVNVIHDWSLENLFVLRHREAAPFLISTCIPQPSDFLRPNLVVASAAHAAKFVGDVPFVRYGVNLARYAFVPRKTSPIAHIAKVAPYKAQHEAMIAALRAWVPLDVFGVVEHGLYHALVVRPLAAVGPGLSWKGETIDLAATLGAAKGLVQTPRWFDVLPMVVIQAMACGTPVVAYPEGGIPEEIEHGRNGLLVANWSDLPSALREVTAIDPAACRAVAEERFAVERMVTDYVKLYHAVIDGEQWTGQSAAAPERGPT